MHASSFKSMGFGFSLGLSLLIVAFWLAWQLLVPVDFGYRAAYSLLAIDQHVEKYGPQNRYKQDFAKTTAAEQQRLFGAIVHEIQHGGSGLRRINYTTTDGRRYSLLREAEAVHLQDVANLITLFDHVAWVALAVLATTIVLMKRAAQPAPSVLRMLSGLGMLVGLCGLILLVIGPTQTFYWLHTQIFPADHEWFFYYQDSLMTTLMKAPDLFGFIAGLWVVLALVVLALAYWGITRWLPSRG